MSNNPLCSCPLAGFCSRHQIAKTGHLYQACKGDAPTADGGWKYWVAWERGLLGATAPPDPITNPPRFLAHQRDGAASERPTLTSSPVNWPQGESCCGNGVSTASIPDDIEYTGTGPGSELLKIYKAAGVPTCPACINLAWQMDQWGADECEARTEAIVEDMLPRARLWVAENHPFIHAILPNVIEDIGVRTQLRSGIVKAIKAAREAPINA